jgi:cytochrome P450
MADLDERELVLVIGDVEQPDVNLGAPLPHLDDIDNPYPALAAARRKGPVQAESPFGETEGASTIHVLGFDEVVAVLRDQETFSSRLLSDVMGPMFAGTMIAFDDPEHRVHRALVAPAFRPKLLAQSQTSVIRRVLDEVVDSFVSLERADLVEELTFAFPVRVIAHILGLPERDIGRFQSWADDFINIFAEWDRGLAALKEFRDYLLPLVAERRSDPQDDLISALTSSEIDDQGLDDEEIFSFVRLLLPAGIETTYRSLGNLLVALLTHPEQLDAIREHPELRQAAIEEGLRWETPFLLLVRESTRDTCLSGVQIPKGTVVAPYVASANHDERRYDNPEAFDIHRPAIPHATFGSGPHACLGMHLSRLETRVALDVLLERLPRLRVDPERPLPRVSGNLAFRSPDTIFVRFS